jgi:hypothetical protein
MVITGERMEKVNARNRFVEAMFALLVQKYRSVHDHSITTLFAAWGILLN